MRQPRRLVFSVRRWKNLQTAAGHDMSIGVQPFAQAVGGKGFLVKNLENHISGSPEVK